MGYSVAIDIDGTLTNDISIMKDCIKAWNLHVENSDAMVKLNLKSVKLIQFPAFMDQQEFWDYTRKFHQYPEISGYARDTVRALRWIGCKVILLTKRPLTQDHSGESPFTGTADWLRRSGVDFDELICTNDGDKSPYLTKYQCKFIVENDPIIIKDLQEHNCSTTPILIRKPYNVIYEPYFKNRAIYINSIYDLYEVVLKALHKETLISGD